MDDLTKHIQANYKKVEGFRVIGWRWALVEYTAGIIQAWYKPVALFNNRDDAEAYAKNWFKGQIESTTDEDGNIVLQNTATRVWFKIVALPMVVEGKAK